MEVDLSWQVVWFLLGFLWGMNCSPLAQEILESIKDSLPFKEKVDRWCLLLMYCSAWGLLSLIVFCWPTWKLLEFLLVS